MIFNKAHNPACLQSGWFMTFPTLPKQPDNNYAFLAFNFSLAFQQPPQVVKGEYNEQKKSSGIPPPTPFPVADISRAANLAASHQWRCLNPHLETGGESSHCIYRWW